MLLTVIWFHHESMLILRPPPSSQVPEEFFVDRGASGHPHVLRGRPPAGGDSEVSGFRGRFRW